MPPEFSDARMTMANVLNIPKKRAEPSGSARIRESKLSFDYFGATRTVCVTSDKVCTLANDVGVATEVTPATPATA